MAKGDDSVMRKKNKARRKKLSRKNDSSSVSARVASIIAAKKRRKSGKRRQCQGMCFSLPSIDDPFNDRRGKKKAMSKNDAKPTHDKDRNVLVNRQSDKMSNDLEFGTKVCDVKNVHNRVIKVTDCHLEEESSHDVRKKSIQDNKKRAITSKEQHWKAQNRKLLGLSRAADTIAMKEIKGVSFSSPFLLYIVASQENTVMVRSIFKPLKPLGIHTVSIHPGAPFDHQIQGLRSCEPEFLVSTPERLFQLLSLKAIDLSGVSLLVVDDLNLATDTSYVNMIKSIKKSTSKSAITVVFNDGGASIALLKDILMGSVC